MDSSVCAPGCWLVIAVLTLSAGAGGAQSIRQRAEAELEQERGRPEDAADPEGALMRAGVLAGRARGEVFAKQVAAGYAFDKDSGARRALDDILFPRRGQASPTAGELLHLARGLPGERYAEHAERALTRSLQLEPRNPETYRELARIMADRGKWEAAADAEHKSNQVSRLPDEASQVRLLAYIGLALRDAGFLDAARDVIDDPATSRVELEPFRHLRAALRGKRFEWGLTLDALPGGRPGVQVAALAHGSPADAAGLETGDRIEKIDGARALDVYSATDALEAAEVGTEVQFVVRRASRLLITTGWKRDDASRRLAEERNAEGVALAQARDFAGAREAFLRAIEADPRFGKTWYNVGLVDDALRDYPGAVAGYLSGLALGLDDDVATQVRRRSDELIERLGGDVEAGFPRESVKLCREGVQHAGADRYSQGLFAYLKALQLSPGYPNALLGAGILESALGMRAPALRALRAYLRVLPQAANFSQVQEQIRALEARPALTPVAIEDTSPWSKAGDPGAGDGGGSARGRGQSFIPLFGPVPRRRR